MFNPTNAPAVTGLFRLIRTLRKSIGRPAFEYDAFGRLLTATALDATLADVRIVCPEESVTGGQKVHCHFDANGDYPGNDRGQVGARPGQDGFVPSRRWNGQAQVFPSREDLTERLRALLAGADRAEISNWAERYMLDNDDERVTDSEAWEVLQAMTGADAPTTDRDYLYDPVDFEAWLAHLTD